MGIVDQIILTLHVPSIEDTAAWYERILGWKGHFDTFDEAGQCLFGSVMLRESLRRLQFGTFRRKRGFGEV
jgi:catechol 2,3-dioxygenase-like lactoylglutathione lyase family enzyme